jgi:NAD(P)-dependent dehydrogenase (short-subunit alcohol dehydrogenase family)
MHMELQLNGKRALITGSTSGIGAEIARMLAAEGVNVVIHGRNHERAEAVAAGLRNSGAEVALALGDLEAAEGIDDVIAQAQAAFGGIDILINNAGAGTAGAAYPDWFDIPVADWEQNYVRNALPAVHLAQAFVPGMRKQGWGRVIQVSSRTAISPQPQGGPYAASKAALNNLTLSLSKALAGTGVTCNGIMPGLIHTAMADPWFAMLARSQGSDDPLVGQQYAIQHILRQTVHRPGRPEDIAAAVCFIASPLSDFMTGTTIRIDGGATPTV